MNLSFIIRMVVLAWGTSDADKTTLNYNRNWRDYSEREMIDMLLRYNGSNSDAPQHGKEVDNLYKLFKEYK